MFETHARCVCLLSTCVFIFVGHVLNVNDDEASPHCNDRAQMFLISGCLVQDLTEITPPSYISKKSDNSTTCVDVHHTSFDLACSLIPRTYVVYAVVLLNGSETYQFISISSSTNGTRAFFLETYVPEELIKTFNFDCCSTTCVEMCSVKNSAIEYSASLRILLNIFCCSVPLPM